MRMSLIPALFFLVSNLVQAQEGTNSIVAGGFVQGHPYEITFARQVANTVKFVFAQDELKETWPYFGYRLGAIRDNPCREGSISRDLTVGNTVALVRPRDGSHDFTGLRIGLAEPVGDGASVGQICDWIQHPNTYLMNIAADIQALASAPCVSSGTWTVKDNGKTLPTDAQPMMTGVLTTDEPDDAYALLWNEQRDGARHIVWEIEQGGDVAGWTPIGGAQVVWKYTPDDENAANASSGVDFYLTYPGGNAIQTDTPTTWECQNGRTLEWSVSFPDDGVAENLLSMWYAPSPASTPQDALSGVIGDDWYLLIDDLLPTVAADIRIERGVLEQELQGG